MPYTVKDVDDVLNQADLRAAFEEFTARSFADENLKFLKAVDNYKKAAKDPNVTDDELRQKARDIHKNFVTSSTDDVPKQAPTTKGKNMWDLTEDTTDLSAFVDLTGKHSQANLKAPCRQDIETNVATLDTLDRAQMSTMFDVARKEIVDLTTLDNVGRFQVTPEYQDALKKANAELAPVEKLEAKLDKLKNPSLTDRFKAFFKGGMDNAREEIADKIDKEKLNLLRKNSPDSYEEEMQQRKQNQDNAKKYFAAQHKAQSAELMQDMLGGTMSKNESAKLEQEKQEALQTVKKLEGEVSARKGLNQVSSTPEEHVSVRKKLDQEAHEHDHHHGPKHQQAPKQKQEQGTHHHLG